MARALHVTIASLSLCAFATAAIADEIPDVRSFEFSEVQAAWDGEGDDGVKDWMRAMLKRNKRAGRRIASSGKKPKCGSCHESLKSYELSPNAVEDLRALMAAERQKPGDD